MADKQSQDKNPGNFKNNPQRASEAGKKGGEQSHSGQSQGGQGSRSSSTQGGTHEQHVKAGQQSHKNK
ncbi:KGG domain-containing protein [Rhodomicrobium lacus]|jgi:general stress protein YciG|uniref:KGG domain-containing protein n=1 Tax=Rhodomicrobium TaxID=1068 RepID=UPI00349F4E58